LNEFLKVNNHHGHIQLFGDLRLGSLDHLMAAMHREAVIARYPDITLDLENLSSITHSVIPPFASYLRYLTQQHKVDYHLIQPRDGLLRDRLKRLGLNHYIDFRRFEKPNVKSSTPALMQFLNTAECDAVTDKIVNSVLRTAKLGRPQMAALEWAVNEITDNVINHSQSTVGGFAIFHKVRNTNIIEITVADSGIGIARSLGMKDEAEAVSRAVQEGVTRDKNSNQGNGLFGSYQLACASKGIFILKSRHGNLFVDKGGETHIRRENVPYPGTIVVCQIDCDQPDLIERGFIFSGKAHTPAYDYVERLHETATDDLVVKAFDICRTFGSRESGREARLYIENMVRALEGNSISIDFAGISVISSSFADEVFGKLFVQMGPMKFMRTIKLTNAVSVVEALIDKAINMRAQTGLD
jgi:anti-sigma regulatory factor (Ser/Thr protein kinase)/anti-anti-sigma regulatory factor